MSDVKIIEEGSVWRHKDGEIVEVLELHESNDINEYYDEDGWPPSVVMVWYRAKGSETSVEPYVRTEKHFLESFTELI